MTGSPAFGVPRISAELNAAELEALRRFLQAAEGNFSLAVAVYGTVAVRDSVIALLRDEFPRTVLVRCDAERADLLEQVRNACQPGTAHAVFVLDMEGAIASGEGDTQPALRTLNASRDLWEGLGCPVVIWLAEYAAARLALHAPDFWRYRSHTFEFVDEPSRDVSQSLVPRPDYAHVDALPYEAKKARVEELEKRVANLPDTVPAGLRPHVTAWKTELAYLYRLLGDFAQSERLYRRVLAEAEVSYGPDHPWVATALNNLAVLLMETNRLAEAEPLLRRALEIDEASYGPHHPKVATDLNNLAGLLLATNRLAEAEPLMQRAIRVFEESLGEKHSDVATALSHLGALRQATNRLAEAEPLMRRALEIDEASYGPHHPEVARVLNNLAGLLLDMNRLAEAEPLLRRALEIDEASYGPGHPSVARDLNHLAALLQATNRLAEAQPLLRRALEILAGCSRATGHVHQHLEQAVRDYGGALLSMGSTEEEALAALRQIVPELFEGE